MITPQHPIALHTWLPPLSHPGLSVFVPAPPLRPPRNSHCPIYMASNHPELTTILAVSSPFLPTTLSASILADFPLFETFFLLGLRPHLAFSNSILSIWPIHSHQSSVRLPFTVLSSTPTPPQSICRFPALIYQLLLVHCWPPDPLVWPSFPSALSYPPYSCSSSPPKQYWASSFSHQLTYHPFPTLSAPAFVQPRLLLTNLSYFSFHCPYTNYLSIQRHHKMISYLLLVLSGGG